MQKQSRKSRPWFCTILAALGFSCAGGEAAELARLRELHRTLMDPEQTFSIRATLAELDALEARIPEGDSPARGEFNFLRGYLHSRREEAEEAVRFTREALRIDAAIPFLEEGDRTYALYRLATNAKAAQAWDTAVTAYERVIPRLAEDAQFDDGQRLGVQADFGYCLHEAGKYAEALTINKATLARGEALYGADSPELLVVITNLAQNAYELKDFAAARAFLERRLATATRHQEVSHVDDSLFQLGVLAFEEGKPQEAEDFMQRRLELARKSGDEARIEAAEEDLRILHEKRERE
jgi:tetratricopeptide (TPR) repeat protein